MRTWKKLATVAAATAALSAGVPTAAQADIGILGTVCNPAYTCNHYPQGNFNGGKLSVDFDGQGNNTYQVRVYISGNLVCSLPPIGGNEPPQSWTCSGLPAGSVMAQSNSGQYAAYHDLGVRLNQ